jgi:hypothetical protein
MSETNPQNEYSTGTPQSSGRMNLSGQNPPETIVNQIEEVSEMWKAYDKAVDAYVENPTAANKLTKDNYAYLARKAEDALKRMQDAWNDSQAAHLMPMNAIPFDAEMAEYADMLYPWMN